ncbi:hypothetical protein GCK32_013329 [Trichostrongylus colubriformis]|uniref:Serpentine receptor class gamma n=1 Tax=Trichostrongylus colubriformis TaxID=6319 RepID=A0AAN8EYD1_TRICO
MVKLRSTSTSSTNSSIALAKAELSLRFLTFVTCLCMVTVTITNLCFLIYSSFDLIITLRPFQLDLQSFLPIWVLYLTHPVFRRKTIFMKTISAAITPL